MRATIATLVLWAFLAGGCTTAPPPEVASAISQEHRPLLETAPNFRDIGGYRTVDGHRVRRGLIYRSDQLNFLSDDDLARMDALGIRLVADLRTEGERRQEPDRIPADAQALVLDVAADAADTLGGDMHKTQAAIAAGKGKELLVAANRDFVSLPSARAAYGTLLRRLARGQEDVVVYHCTAGKDRTGWATAIILTLLGVPRETVMADYLASNRMLAGKNATTLATMRATGSVVSPALYEQVLTVRPEYLQSAFNEVTLRYGTFDNYVRKGLGLSEADITALRQRHLQ